MITNKFSDIVMIGVGGAGGHFVRNALAQTDLAVKGIVIDCDQAANINDERVDFYLAGEERLRGNSTGGNSINARAAVLDDESAITELLQGYRFAVVVCGLGKGFGSGATPEILKIAKKIGITTLLFATLPFDFEGKALSTSARKYLTVLEECADSVISVPLDKLYAKTEEMPIEEAISEAERRMTTQLLLFWNILLSPGYITVGFEKIISVIEAGQSSCHLAMATASGIDRAEKAISELFASPLLHKQITNGSDLTTILGVIADKDLRLAELSVISKGFAEKLPQNAELNLSTIIDDGACGSITLVAIIFEGAMSAVVTDQAEAIPTSQPQTSRRRTGKKVLSPINLQKSERFRGVESTIYDGEDLDIPTYLRRHINLGK